MEKKVYKAPCLTIVRFRNEKGYAASLAITVLTDLGSDEVEGRDDEGGYWGSGSDGDTWF